MKMMINRIITYTDASLTNDDVKRIKDKLSKDDVDVISLRNCNVTDKDYKLLMKSIGTSRTLRHLNLALDQVTDKYRVQILAQALQKNISLAGLHLHGNPITDGHLATLNQPLFSHPRLVCVDVSDCCVGDEGISILTTMLKDKKERHGLQELLIGHNTAITAEGWRRLAMALAAGSSLRTLHIDYNAIGDISASCLITALPGAVRLETLDMECTGVTDVTGQMLLHLLKSFKLKLKTINLKRNNIPKPTKNEIKLKLNGTWNQDLLNMYTGNEITSEDSRSLATSEPPLENDSSGIFHEYANLSRPVSAHATGNTEISEITSNIRRLSLDNQIDRKSMCPSVLSFKSNLLESRSLMGITANDEPTLDLKKAKSMENLDKFGKDSKEYQTVQNETTSLDIGDSQEELRKKSENIEESEANVALGTMESVEPVDDNGDTNKEFKSGEIDATMAKDMPTNCPVVSKSIVSKSHNLSKPSLVSKPTAISKSPDLSKSSVLSKSPDLSVPSAVSKSPDLSKASGVSKSPDVSKPSAISKPSALSKSPDLFKPSAVSKSPDLLKQLAVSIPNLSKPPAESKLPVLTVVQPKPCLVGVADNSNSFDTTGILSDLSDTPANTNDNKEEHNQINNNDESHTDTARCSEQSKCARDNGVEKATTHDSNNVNTAATENTNKTLQPNNDLPPVSRRMKKKKTGNTGGDLASVIRKRQDGNENVAE